MATKKKPTDFLRTSEKIKTYTKREKIGEKKTNKIYNLAEKRRDEREQNNKRNNEIENETWESAKWK